MVMSFSPDQPIYIGRSKQCALRLDAADVSARHARMGFEAGEFWVEDLGSTNGTFVNDQQISGRVNIAPNTPVILGREISITGVLGDEAARAATVSSSRTEHKALDLPRYPVLISTSEVARPARLTLPLGAEVNVGRDSSSEMWLGAPHVSRRHVNVKALPDGTVQVTDWSTNGTGYDGGVLRKGETLDLDQRPQVFDVGSGITLAICFNEDQERRFLSSNGANTSFSTGTNGSRPGTISPDGEIESSISLRDRRVEELRRDGFSTWLRNYFLSRGVIGWAQLICSLLALMLVLYLAINELIRISTK